MGYMGSGKSSIGKAFSLKTKKHFIDLDKFIESTYNSNISSIFKQKGEIFFRKIERQCLEQLLNSNKYSIISIGGGTPCYFDTIHFLNKLGHITIFFKASINTLTNRLFNEIDNRPLISHLGSREKLSDFIAKHLFERNKYYNKAQFLIEVDGKDIATIINELENKLT
tara:strand:+ start:392 stop:895 length:504 start_codon:yes stop_codon:yes gene_type:complete